LFSISEWFHILYTLFQQPKKGLQLVFSSFIFLLCFFFKWLEKFLHLRLCNEKKLKERMQMWCECNVVANCCPHILVRIRILICTTSPGAKGVFSGNWQHSLRECSSTLLPGLQNSRRICGFAIGRVSGLHTAQGRF
jgi:hypothetical protein